MSAIRSTVWGIVVILALAFIAILAYGSCYNRP